MTALREAVSVKRNELTSKLVLVAGEIGRTKASAAKDGPLWLRVFELGAQIDKLEIWMEQVDLVNAIERRVMQNQRDVAMGLCIETAMTVAGVPMSAIQAAIQNGMEQGRTFLKGVEA